MPKGYGSTINQTSNALSDMIWRYKVKRTYAHKRCLTCNNYHLRDFCSIHLCGIDLVNQACNNYKKR